MRMCVCVQQPQCVVLQACQVGAAAVHWYPGEMQAPDELSAVYCFKLEGAWLGHRVQRVGRIQPALAAMYWPVHGSLT